MNFKRLFFTVAVIAITISSAIAQNLNVTFRSQLQYPGQTCANICGYVDSLGNEYALVGASLGMSIVDVTNPNTPVEVLQIPGPDNLWKEIKVRGKYAYVTSEGGNGLQIVNLSSLPNTAAVVSHYWTGDGAIAGQLNTIHALHIDNNFVYLYGSNLFNGGAVVADITDPWNPTYVGKYENTTSSYVHDGYVRNDTLYAGHIYDGFYSVVDFTNKAAPVELVSQQFTPTQFTHNTWLSTDSKTLFTTDENDGSFLTSYDVSDLGNINELDRIQSNPGSQSIVHNTHIIKVAGNDYAVTSWYKDGFTIVDAGRPHNLIQVGDYDSYPAGSGAGFEGDWGVYPYLPSGTIVVSNIDEGLFVFSPNYVRACYLEGIVTDSITGNPINAALVEILTTSATDNTKISGDYATGIPSPGGTYSVRYSKPGYITKVITGLTLSAGLVTMQDVELSPIATFAITGQVVEQGTSNGIANANVRITSATFDFQTTADASGNFTLPAVYADNYQLTGGKWGYVTNCAQSQSINASTTGITIELTKGYYDDFTFDFGWTVNGTATVGAWERGEPVGTMNNTFQSNPEVDDATDCFDQAFITGNGGGAAGDNDVDGGYTLLKSPYFDLTSYTDAYLDYSRWFYTGGGSGTLNDSLNIYISNNSTTVRLEFANSATISNSNWVYRTFDVSTYITPTDSMRLIIRTADNAPGHLVEAGFDKFLISEGPTGINESTLFNAGLKAYPNPFTNQVTIAYNLTSSILSNASLIVTDVTGRIVASQNIGQNAGSIVLNPDLSEGVYFVRIVNGAELSSPVKIIKLK